MLSLDPSASDSDPDNPVTDATRIGPYRLEAKLGGGGMGDVYRAIDERLGRTVAIKRVRAPVTMAGLDLEHFRREARLIAKLSHPAIVQLFDVVEDDTGGWIVMELVEGRSLSSLLDAGPLDLATALPILSDVAEALDEAHAKGILHRDLKAENVMVTPAGRAKLLDFGLARWSEPGETEEHDVLEEQIFGTPYAMSPEQTMSLELDQRSDLFSLGTLIYETITGTRPFQGDDLVTTLREVCVARQRPARELEPQIPGALSRLIDWMLEKEPDDRPARVEEVASVLRRWSNEELGEPDHERLTAEA